MKISKKKQNKKCFKKEIKLKNKTPIKTQERQILESIEQLISLNVDSFLALTEEGDPTQIALAYQKAKNEFIKFGPQMHQIAQNMGGDLLDIVSDFLESIDTVLYGQGVLNEDQISHCLDIRARLKAELKHVL